MDDGMQRAHRVLAIACRGEHHADNVRERYVGTPMERLEASVADRAATFDFDLLTRLVVAAHDECVRADIHGTSRCLRISLYPRHARVGRIDERHPTMEEAIYVVREGRTDTVQF